MTASSPEGLRCPSCQARGNRNLESPRLISRPEIRRGPGGRVEKKERVWQAIERATAALLAEAEA